MRFLIPRIRAVAFDVVGTLLHAQPSVAEVYQQFGFRYGADLSIAELQQRFRHVMSSTPQEGETSEAEEFRFWQTAFQQIMGEVRDPDRCFQEVYDYFSHAAAWRIDAQACSLLQLLRGAGYRTVLASNFDVRLQRVIEEMPELQGFDHVFISSQVGWRKPHARFFEAIIERLELPPSEILMVGDTLENDILPAIALGMQTLYLSPQADSLPGGNISSVTSLIDIWEWCQRHE